MTNPIKKKIVLFDFDGVIADSYDAALQANLAADPNISEKEWIDMFNGNMNDWKKKKSQELADKEEERFFNIYTPLMLNSVKPFEGMERVIINLSLSYKLIIISSNITSPIKEFLEKFKLSGYFDEIMGNDIHNSKVEKNKMVFKKHRVNPSECIFITDTLGDIKEASHAKIRSIGVAWGFQKKENLLKGNPLQIAERPEDLCPIINKYFNKKSFYAGNGR